MWNDMKGFCTRIRAWLAIAALVASASAAAATVNNASLHTWWHGTHELNASTPVADNAVRRSTFYDVRVATSAAPNAAYDSFPYMSIPRGGREKWGYTDRAMPCWCSPNRW